MLAYVLALVIGIGSIAMYIAAFFFPEVHRKNDFIWSGVGLFYALVLWVCAGRITGGVLLGQMASVALLGWFGWQTLTLRRAIASPDQQTAIPNQNELQEKLKNAVPSGKLQGLQQQVTGLFGRFSKGKSEAKSAQEAVSRLVKDKTPATPDMVETTATLEPTATPTPESPELVPPHPPAPELVEMAQKSDSPDAAESQVDAAKPIEEIAPEVELAPPAEPPGSGDPEDRGVGR